MVTVNKDYSIDIGDGKQYGAIQLSEEEWLDIEEFNHPEEEIPKFPLSAILTEGNIAYIKVDSSKFSDIIERKNPFRIQSINSRPMNGNRSLTAISLDQSIIKLDTVESDMEITIELEEEILSETIRNYSPNMVVYNMVPDLIVCKEADVSDEVLAQLI